LHASPTTASNTCKTTFIQNPSSGEDLLSLKPIVQFIGLQKRQKGNRSIDL
jgi:hypothetical protein